MIILNNPSCKLQIKLSGSPDTEFFWSVGYEDDSTYGSANGTTNGTTATSIAGGIQGIARAPFFGKRKIINFTVFNTDTTSKTVSIISYDGTDSRTLIEVLLHPQYTLHYDNTWYVTNEEGAVTTSNISTSAITIGDTVIGGVDQAFLYVDGDGNLACADMKQTGTAITIPNTDTFGSDSVGGSQIWFGNGYSTTLSTDSLIGDTPWLRIGPDPYTVDSEDFILFSASGQVLSSSTRLNIQHPTTILFSSPTISFQNNDLVDINFSTFDNYMTYNPATASRVAVFDASKNLISSSVTLISLSYLDATSSIQAQLNSLATATLANTKIFVGNASNIATAQSLSLNATGGTFGLGNTGILTMPNADASTRGLLPAADFSNFASKQPGDADLTAIAALSGTSGFLKTNGAGTWSVDTATYLTTSSASSTYAPIASPTFTGTVILGQDAASGLQAVTYQQLQIAINGVDKEAVKYATIAALPAIIYNNTNGTLTGVAFGALGIDSASPSVGDYILVKNQVSTFQNGWYIVTATGSGIAVFVLTRRFDSNVSSEFKTGDASLVTSGSTLATSTWAYSGIDSPVLGTDAITFVQTAGPGSYIAGNGVLITGTTISIDTTVTVDKTTVQTLSNKTFVTPVLGAATATSINGLTLTSSTGIVTITNAKTLAVSDSITLATNSILFAGSETLTLTAAKSVTFGDAFTTTGTNPVTFGSNSTTSTFTLPTGTGSTETLVGRTSTDTLTNKTLTTPTIGSFINATHNHQNAAGGGQLNASNIFSGGVIPVLYGGTGVSTIALENRIKLTADQNITSTTLTNITDWVFTATANKNYDIEGWIKLDNQTIGAAAGTIFAITIPSGTLWVNFNGTSTSNTTYLTLSVAVSGTSTSSLTPFVAEAQKRNVYFRGQASVGGSGGNIQFQAALKTAGQTSTFSMEGSTFKITQTN